MKSNHAIPADVGGIVESMTSTKAIMRKFLANKKSILATGLIGLVAVAIVGYYVIQGIGRASIQGIYIRMFGWTRCYSDTPSPHVNITTNAVLIFSTHPSPFDTNVRSPSFLLTVDSFRVGTFQLPYDTYFTSDHESIPWLRYTVFNSSLVKAIVEKNSSSISLRMNAEAETIFYHQAVERSDSFNTVWRPSVLASSPGCQDGYRS